MKAGDRSEFLDQLAQYGYPLMKPEVSVPPERVLESLLQQDDTRLLEGFPVVLANGLRQKKRLAWEDPKWNPGRTLSKKSQGRLVDFLALSHLLFQLFGLEEELGRRTKKMLSKVKNGNETLLRLHESFVRSQPLRMGKGTLSTERLKNNFRNYVVHAGKSQEVQAKKHALELELLLSEVFTPRQKELLKKRLEGSSFTKTEKEYFYRVIKKRLKALANEELHHWARNLLAQ